MNSESENYSSNFFDDEFDIKQLFNIFFKGKLIIISSTLIGIILSAIYSFSLPNIYKSDALLAPVIDEDALSSSLNNYSGLASIAGINIPDSSNNSNAVKGIEKLSSLSFFEENIYPFILVQDLIAVEYWDYKTNKLIYDESIYLEDKNEWIRNYSYPLKQIPSPQESFKIFHENHLSLSKDRESGFISVSIKHQSPYIAKEWTELLINKVNSFYRQKDRYEANMSVKYLNDQLASTQFVEVKEVLALLQQKQIQKLALIESNKSYVYEYIDRPAVMEQKTEPNRVFIIIISAFFSAIISMFFVIIRFYLNK